MKITVPAIAVDTVGFRTISPVRSYYYDRRRQSVLPPHRYEDIKEVRLTTAVVFDRDLRVAARLRAVGTLAALTAGIAVLIPLAAIHVFGQSVGRVILLTADRIMDLQSMAGVDQYASIRRQYAELAREVVR